MLMCARPYSLALYENVPLPSVTIDTTLGQASVAESSVALPPVQGWSPYMSDQTARHKASLKIIPEPGMGAVVGAPPILNASDHTVDYCCGQCGTVLMHAEDNQVHGLTIHCTNCGSYNSTDS